MGDKLILIFNRLKKLLKDHSTILIFVILICIVSLFHIGCLIKYTIGIPCPGCGLTRATLAFFQLDIRTAFQYHPLFWIVIPLLVFVIYEKKTLFNNKRIELTIYSLVGMLFLGVYFYRMVVLFPNIEPMTINYNSIAIRIFTILKSLLL